MLWAPFREGFFLGDSGLHSDVGFRCVEQKWPPHPRLGSGDLADFSTRHTLPGSW